MVDAPVELRELTEAYAEALRSLGYEVTKTESQTIVVSFQSKGQAIDDPVEMTVISVEALVSLPILRGFQDAMTGPRTLVIDNRSNGQQFTLHLGESGKQFTLRLVETGEVRFSVPA